MSRATCRDRVVVVLGKKALIILWATQVLRPLWY